MKMRLIQPAVAIPRYRMLRMPVIAAEFCDHIDVEINDENIDEIDYSPVDLVGLTCQTYNSYRAFYIANRFRERGVKTILGGVFATAMPEMALEHFDSVVVGEVEGLGEEIVSDLKKGALKKVYRNERPPDLTSTNKPRIDLLRNGGYYGFNFPIETQRGCPHNCSFCFCRYQYPTVRQRSLQDIERDLREWDHGVVEVLDHHFAADKKHLFGVCELFKSMNVLAWIGEATLVSLKDEETVKKLSESNCRMVFVGLESISAQVLSGVNKRFNDVKEFKRVMEMCHDHGIYIHGGFIWGLDGQDETVYDETLRFCDDVRMYLAGSNLVTYFPGTEIYKEVETKGLIISKDHRDYDSAHITALPDGFDAEKLLKGVKSFQDGYYSLGSIFRRAFQSTNSNLMMLTDFVGFNLAYRSYYRNWIKIVGQGLEELLEKQRKGESLFKEAPKDIYEGEGMPFQYGTDLGTYTISYWIWRYWNFWLHLFFARRGAPHPAFTVGSVLAYLASVLALLEYEGIPVIGLPVSLGLPPLAEAILLYLALIMSTGWAIFTVSKNVGGRLLLSSLSLALSAPLFCMAWTVEPPLLRLALAFLNVVFLLKNEDFFSSAQRSESSYYRYHVFMFLYPSLDFNKSFQIDFVNSTFRTAFRSLAVGMLQVALAWGAYFLIMHLFITRPEAYTFGSSVFWAATALKALYVYLAFAGVMNVIISSWRVWGYMVDDPFESPQLASSGGDFWRRFDTEHYRWSMKNLYLPMTHRRGGGKRASRLALLPATLLPFLITALLCAYVFGSVLVGEVTSYRMSAEGLLILMSPVFVFFLGHGSLVALERLLLPRPRGRWRRWAGVRALKIALTLLFVIASSALFFFVTDRVFLALLSVPSTRF
ncbi:B12-binding domain-containing radical SAM protein [Elusimicrobiota bacterium]